MCMADGGDSPEVYREKLVKGRKEHKCEECGRSIAVGEEQHYIFMIYDGDASECRICLHCWVACSWLIKNCDGYLIGAITDDIAEHAYEYPGLSFAMNRIVVGARRKWRNFRGDALLPLPKIPPSIVEHFAGVAS